METKNMNTSDRVFIIDSLLKQAKLIREDYDYSFDHNFVSRNLTMINAEIRAATERLGLKLYEDILLPIQKLAGFSYCGCQWFDEFTGWYIPRELYHMIPEGSSIKVMIGGDMEEYKFSKSVRYCGPVFYLLKNNVNPDFIA